MKERLLAALDLADFSICLMRQNIRRALPDAPTEIVDAQLHRWLLEQPVHFQLQFLLLTAR